jgi:Zn-dependent protease with chaperone function
VRPAARGRVDAFELQAASRARRRRLLALFALSVAAVVAGVVVGMRLGWDLVLPPERRPRFYDAVNLMVPLLLVVGGALVESAALRAGGSAGLVDRLGARRLDATRPLERRLRNCVEEMAIASGLPPPDTRLMESDAINAMAVGWSASDAALVFTRGALERLTRAELQGVVAHELGHVAAGDMRLNTQLLGWVWGLELLWRLGLALVWSRTRTRRALGGLALGGRGAAPVRGRPGLGGGAPLEGRRRPRGRVPGRRARAAVDARPRRHRRGAATHQGAGRRRAGHRWPDGRRLLALLARRAGGSAAGWRGAAGWTRTRRWTSASAASMGERCGAASRAAAGRTGARRCRRRRPPGRGRRDDDRLERGRLGVARPRRLGHGRGRARARSRTRAPAPAGPTGRLGLGPAASALLDRPQGALALLAALLEPEARRAPSGSPSRAVPSTIRCARPGAPRSPGCAAPAARRGAWRCSSWRAHACARWIPRHAGGCSWRWSARPTPTGGSRPWKPPCCSWCASGWIRRRPAGDRPARSGVRREAAAAAAVCATLLDDTPAAPRPRGRPTPARCARRSGCWTRCPCWPSRPWCAAGSGASPVRRRPGPPRTFPRAVRRDRLSGAHAAGRGARPGAGACRRTRLASGHEDELRRAAAERCRRRHGRRRDQRRRPRSRRPGLGGRSPGVGCLDLDEAARWLEARLGVAADAGGVHDGFGTRNRLLSLGDDLYLEVLAPDPAQARPARPRLFGLDEPSTRERLARGPALLHWVVRAPTPVALDALAAGPLAEAVGPVVPMRRGELAWRIALRDDGARPPGGLPTPIDWGVAAHPCTRLPDRGWRLERLAIEVDAPAARWLRARLDDPRVALAAGSSHAGRRPRAGAARGAAFGRRARRRAGLTGRRAMLPRAAGRTRARGRGACRGADTYAARLLHPARGRPS